MNVLYVSTVFPREGTSTIYTDLAEALVEHGHEVAVVTNEERRSHMPTSMTEERGCKVLRVKTGNMYDVGRVEKGISIITMAWLMKRAMKKHLMDFTTDIILFEAPPVTMESVVSFAKRKFGSKSFLMMKDIFPQNAIDIGIIKKNSLVYRYFRHKEKRLYRTADMIGCMSEGNIKYLNEVSGIKLEKLSVFPNTKKIRQISVDRNEVRKKYKLPLDKVIFVFGGNMGRPQGLDFLVDAIIKSQDVKDAFFLLVGRGTEHKRTQALLKGIHNNIVLENLPRDEYEQLVCCCDVGIISLDHRFTVPNYPSRILAYMECSMPVLGATDKNTDFRKLLESEAQCGIWCDSACTDDFVTSVKKMVASPDMRMEMGRKGRTYLEDHLSVEYSVKLLENI